jgi:predicted transport protein
MLMFWKRPRIDIINENIANKVVINFLLTARIIFDPVVIVIVLAQVLYFNGKRFTEFPFQNEEEFERLVVENAEMLFGERSFYMDLKSRVEGRALGAAVPDGLLIDFRDPENPEFYLVEVELAQHDFYKHIFPQVTKFFAFFKNPKSRAELVEKTFTVINSDPHMRAKFNHMIGGKEIYKSLKDIVENSQNILIIIDDEKPEFGEVMETYTETWDKMVKVMIIKRYHANGSIILAVSPDFEKLLEQPIEEDEEEVGEESDRYTEEYHLGGVAPNIVKAYERIKQEISHIDPEIRINPQKYYISLRKERNFAYIRFRKRKMHIVLMMSYEQGKQIIKRHKLSPLSEGIKKFYGGECFTITIEHENDLEEVIQAIMQAYKQQKQL